MKTRVKVKIPASLQVVLFQSNESCGWSDFTEFSSATPHRVFNTISPLHFLLFSQALLFLFLNIFQTLLQSCPPQSPSMFPPSEPCRLTVSCWPGSPTSSSSAADWLGLTWLSSSTFQPLLFIGLADSIEPAPPSSSYSFCLFFFPLRSRGAL